MGLRIKLMIFFLLFLLLIGLFTAGTTFVFYEIDRSLVMIRKASDIHHTIEMMKKDIISFSKDVKNWAFTGNKKYKKGYLEKLNGLTRSIDEIKKFNPPEDVVMTVVNDLQELKRIANTIMTIKEPTKSRTIFFDVRDFDDREIGLLNDIEQLEIFSIHNINTVLKTSENIKGKVSFYAYLIIAFSFLSLLILLVIIKRSIHDPFREILRITEMPEDEEIRELEALNRRDEFGQIAKRFAGVFNRLIESEKKLKARLEEVELLFEVTRIAGLKLELDEALRTIVEIISERMAFDYIAIYLIDEETQRFQRRASNKNGDIFIDEVDLSRYFISIENGQLKIKTRHGVTTSLFKKKMLSVLVTPILRNEKPLGGLLFAYESKKEFKGVEKNIANILSNTLSTIITNAELYSSTKKQLKKISVLYELSNALTTVVDFDELLKKVAHEVTRLIGAKGCIIRMREKDGSLVVRAYYGVPEDVIREMDLKVGDSLAGRVAETGSAILIEDMKVASEDLKVPVLDVHSAICVPLRIGDEIIGTVGLYDKKTSTGELIAFDTEDLKTTEGFSSIISLAIEKARLFEMQVQKEKETQEAKKRLDLLFETVQNGIVTLDRHYNVLSVNKYVLDLLQEEYDNVVGRSALEVFHEKGLICPHCVAKLTFETGDYNVITQTRGANYAELSSYPVKDEEGNVQEAVVLIQDITDKVLYQEEILSLYKEVAQTKDYLESIIDNSADAIITTDLNGIVTQWNKGAERIYGFTEQEALGSFLPFIPDFLMDTERQYMERIKKGETIRDIETLRRRKDGKIIEVSLTLSPIKDATGEVIGISGISRDISEKKKVEKELIRRNQELSRLFFISSAMRSTLELDRLLRMVLTAVTMSDGLGFNRAILFLYDEERNVLKGTMGVGPSSPEEAWQVWERLSIEKKSLPELLKEIERGPLRKDSFLDKLSTGIELDVESTNTAMALSIKERKPIVINSAKENPVADPIIIQQLGSEDYAVVPLISRDKVIGAIWVDNYFNRKPITDEDIKFLTGFADQVASAIESARLFEKVKLAEAELENIFESISDLLYITTEDYTIRNINRAVVEKIGLPREEIIGKKCYEIFHGTDEPYEKCPHHKTVLTQKAYIEEFEDPYRGGTFLTSTSPLFDTAGNFLGTVHIVRDISELKKLREKLATSQRMAALGEVAAKVAHEIRNPLVSIGGFSRRLEKKLDGSLKEYAAIITREVTRLEEILRDILSFVKEVRINREEVRGVDIVEEVLSLFNNEIRKKGIVVEKDFRDPLELYVDQHRIKEALINIVSNALSVLDEGGRLTCSTYREDNRGIIEIKDNGPGIDEKDMPFIFDPFFTTKIEGTGLGLAITHRIIEEHNGKIDVMSKKGQGTVFRITLPLREKQV